jgi:hypothetical protein
MPLPDYIRTGSRRVAAFTINVNQRPILRVTAAPSGTLWPNRVKIDPKKEISP